MNYEQAVEWLYSLGRVSEHPGPGRMQEMMAALGNPQRRLRYVHIAGTNGKGSATVMLAAILKEAGYRVGANIGPFVHTFRERFQVNGVYAGEEEIAEAVTKVKAAADTMQAPPLTFVATTATAFVLFEQAGCDIVCLEAGIGGAHDDTNIIEDTLVACMMRIGYDHTELLGDTISQIATDKCGIFKNHCDVVSYPAQLPKALQVIQAEAQHKGCKLVVPSVEDIHYYASSAFENRISYGGYDLVLPFLGAHQGLNAAVVVEAALCLWRRGFAIQDEHIIKGIENATLPGRIEILSRKPLVILDGAHNEDSVSALAATLRQGRVAGLTAVIGILKDKSPNDMLRQLAPFIHTLYTVTPNSPRALPASRLAEVAAPRIKHVQACDSVGQAVEKARQNPGNGILVCGSFYILSDAKRAFGL